MFGAANLSVREKRKLDQANAIMRKQENERLQKLAKRIARKDPSVRTSEELLFGKKHRLLLLDAEKRRAQKQLNRERRLEIIDSTEDLNAKCQVLAEAIREAKHAVVYTGAGISTAADIPDYRGPNGLWTRQRMGRPCIDPNKPIDLTKAEPTFTHMALARLQEMGLVKYVVSQNCDGLHIRSGLSRSCLSELHGNMYMEMCTVCEPNTEYFRYFDLTKKTRWRRHQTGRKCHECGSPLNDTIVLFGEKSRTEAPMFWESAAAHAAAADVVICLGTSLTVLKDYPCLWTSQSSQRLFIVNLQWTPKDAICDLKIHGRCDDVMRRVAACLSVEPKKYNQNEDALLELLVPLREEEQSEIESYRAIHGSAGWYGQGLKLSSVEKKKSSKKRHKCV